MTSSTALFNLSEVVFAAYANLIAGTTASDSNINALTQIGLAARRNEAATFEGQDYLDGEDGDDKLTGGGSDDELFGEDGDDTMCVENAVVGVCSRPDMDVNIGGENQSQCVLQAMLGRGQHRRPAQACNDAAFYLLRGAA